MKKDDKVFLQHILDAMARIEQYLEGISIEQFMQNGLIQDGVIRQLEIIGEASRNLSPDLCQSHPEVEWRQIIGLRNRIAHAYYIGSAEGHEYPDLQVGDEVNPRPFFMPF